MGVKKLEEIKINQSSNDTEASSRMQISLIIEYYKNQNEKIISELDNQQCIYWIQNFAARFRELWEM
jgi:hypothetical protein